MIKEICFQTVSLGKTHPAAGPNGSPCPQDADKPDPRAGSPPHTFPSGEL